MLSSCDGKGYGGDTIVLIEQGQTEQQDQQKSAFYIVCTCESVHLFTSCSGSDGIEVFPL